MFSKLFKWAGIIFLACFVNCTTVPKPFYYTGSNSSKSITMRTVKIWIDRDFGDGDLIAIDNAIKQWNVALNGWIILEVMPQRFNMEEDIIKRSSGGEGWLIMKIDSSNPMVNDDSSGKVLGMTNDIGGSRMWIVRNRLPNEWVTGVTLHEIGHLLGARHQGDGLMRPDFFIDSAGCVDYDAAEQVADYLNIEVNQMKYCIYGNNPN